MSVRNKRENKKLRRETKQKRQQAYSELMKEFNQLHRKTDNYYFPVRDLRILSQIISLMQEEIEKKKQENEFDKLTNNSH
jgi:hypothetical protein